MASNILVNRISTTLNPEQVQKTKIAFQSVREQLPFLVGLTNTERQTLPKMSPASRAFTEDAIAVISNNTDMFPAYLDGTELSKDLQLYDQFR